MAKVKGNLIYHLRNAFFKQIGEEEFKKVLEKTSKETNDMFHGVIISGEMYELKNFQELVNHIYSEYGKEKLEKLGEELAEKQFRGIFGFILKVVTLEQIMRKGQIMWNKIYDKGEINFKTIDKNSFSLTIKNFNFTEGHLLITAAYFRRWIDILKGKKSEIQIIKQEDNSTIFRFDY